MANMILKLLFKVLNKSGSKWKTVGGLVLMAAGYGLPLAMKSDPTWTIWGDRLLALGASLSGVGMFDKALKFDPEAAK